MATVDEIVATTHTHEYKVSFKSAVWGTIAAVVALGGLYALFGLPPGFDMYYEVMFFHAIGIGIAALAVYLVIVAFDLRKYEPGLDMPLYYRALSAVLFGAIGGLLFLIPDTQGVRGLPMVFTFLGLLMLADAGGALFIELLLLPRKIAGTYAVSYELRPVPTQTGYLSRVIPRGRADWAAYREMNASYWLVLVSVASAVIAGLIGFANLWVMTFGPSIFQPLMNWLGLDQGGFLDATKDPHSHEIALAIMAGVIGIAVQRFGVLYVAGWRQKLAKVGVWISIVGVIGMTVVFLAISFANFSPPTLFADASGNGMAGDDAVMAIIAVGAMVLLVPMALTPREADGRAGWRDPLRLAILGTWVAAVVVSVVAGFYIEFHEDVFSSTLAANDAIFGELQSLFGVFVLTAASLFLLGADLYKVEGRSRRLVGWLALAGTAVATAGAMLWAFVDPTVGGASFWIHVGGIGVIGAGALVAAVAIRATPVPKGSVLRIYTAADLAASAGPRAR